MTPLQKFQIAFADYSAGEMSFDTLLKYANEAAAIHPGYVNTLLQKFKMSKSVVPEAGDAGAVPPGRECWVTYFHGQRKLMLESPPSGPVAEGWEVVRMVEAQPPKPGVGE